MLRTSFLLLMTLSSILFAAPALPENRLISTDWLADHLQTGKLHIVDLRADIKDYWAGHIPGAVYFNVEALRLADHGVPVKLTQPEILAAMLGEMGIDRDTAVIIYSEGGDYKAPYLLWALDYLGHKSVGIMDGGYGKWMKEKKPTTQDYPAITPVTYPLPRELVRSARADLDEVKHAVTFNDEMIVDVRPVKAYTGEEGTWKRKGHIAGSISHFWGEDLNPDGTWKSKDELIAAYTAQDITWDKKIIVSCGQGLMSAHAYFTLKYVLGFAQVKNYDGGFNEWSNIEALPVETGMPK
jgi:thiosulfate/3-mercaptopyruvate sulfurtransferase